MLQGPQSGLRHFLLYRSVVREIGERENPGVKPISPLAQLQAFIEGSRALFVLTGAGCSTSSGIPAYRDARGDWTRRQPVTWQDFRSDPQARQRYWGRSTIGWLSFGAARPNPAHAALVTLEERGRLTGLVTQNVDGLHQAAGHLRVIDLHGRLDTVMCLSCGAQTLRKHLQHRLVEANPGWLDRHVNQSAPDGDADLEGADYSGFNVPNCLRCGGLLKPDVVFFGENVPRRRVEQSMEWLDDADAMLVVGSSLMVYSGYRYVLRARERSIPVAAINLGRTRADPLLDLKLELCCVKGLAATVGRL
jgi:NAD-dependent SIR2 family protein deacetylase